MKKLLSCMLALSLAISIALPYTASAYASASFTTPSDVSVVPLGDSKTTIRHANSVGFYLDQEIPQGLEFTILGEGDFALMMDEVNGGYYLVEDVTDLSGLVSSGLRFAPQTFSASSYNDPSTPISTTSGGRTVSGVWWGGILDDVGIVGSVAASTIATSTSTQSKASVKPGLTAAWEVSDWKDTNVKAWKMASVGIAGNQAKWDLQAK